MTDTEVIEALGGYKIVGRMLGLSEENSAHLAKRPIPWKHRPAIQALAKKRRIRLPADFLGARRIA